MAKNGMPESLKMVLMWGIGIGILALTILILLVIFGNLSGNLGFQQVSSSIVNESMAFSDGGTTPTNASGYIDVSLSLVSIINATGNETVPSTNYTISGAVITADSDSPWNGTTVKVTYTQTYDGDSELDAEEVITDYTTSATNLSGQFGVVGTMIGIALLLTVLIGILVFAVRKLMGATTTGGTSVRSNGGFG